MEKKLTNRGFGLYEFVDRCGSECSLQKSSSAIKECIWLGVTDAKVQEFVPNGVGWRDVQLPKDALISSRMHLSQEQVKELLPILQKFAETGEI